MREHCLLRILLCAVFGIAVQHLGAVEITGKVITVSGATLAARMEGELTPNVGDKVEIFFKLAGVEGDVLVAAGSVLKVEGDSIQVKIERATADVAKDQLVRITSEKPQQKNAVAAANPSSSPAARTSPATLSASEFSLVGRWSGKVPSGDLRVVFKEDGTAVVMRAGGVGEGATGKYAIDSTSSPVSFEIHDLSFLPPADATDEEMKEFEKIKEGVMAEIKEMVFLGEFDGPARIRIEPFPKNETTPRPKFGPKAALLSRVPPGTSGTDVAAPSPSAPVASPTPAGGGQTPVPAPAANATLPPLPPVQPPSSTAPPRRGKLVLEDTGDNPKDLLQIAGNKNVNGEREMIANPGSWRTRPYNNIPRDFYVEGVVRSTTSGPSCVVGFFFRTLDERDTMVTYESIIFGPGRIGYGSLQNRQSRASDVRALPPGVYTDATRPVTIGLEAIGSEYRVFINENCVASFTGADPSKGRGLSLVLLNEGQTLCTSYYDNVKIYAASTAGQTSGEKKAKLKPRKR